MKIIILGAGQVGGTLAATLSSENIDITLVDVDQTRLNELRDRLDIQTVTGMASHPDVLARAGAEDADILIAVTNSDEVNMVACQVCYTRFRTPQKIARIRATSYLDRTEQLFNDEHIPIDVLIHPEQLVTDHIARLIAHPGALQVLDFAHGRIELVAVRASEGGPLVDQELRFLRRHIPDVDTKVAAIFRKGRALLPREDTVVEKDDEVFFIAARKHIDKVMRELQRAERAYKRIMVAGGGNIGLRLAQTLEQRLSVKIIERSPERCAHLSETLQRAVVLQGSATDRELLLSENIENTDVFCALTNDDEANIMSSLLAKRLGVRRVMTLINKPAYVDLVQDGQIDIAISPQQTTVSGLLTHVRRADIVMDHTLRRGAAEAIEAIAHGDPGTSRVVGRSIGEIRLPLGATIGAIARGDKVLIGHDDVRIEPDDHVILFLTDRRKLPAVEKLFQVGLTFF